MSRPHYILLSGLLSCAIGLAIGGFGDVLFAGDLPYAGTLGRFIASGAGAALTAGAAGGLIAFMLIGFFLPAIADSAALGALADRIRRIATEPTPEAFLAAFRHTLLEEGRSCAMGLWQKQAQAGASDPIWRSPRDPETLFGTALRTRAAHGALFGQVGLALLALGIAAVALIEHEARPGAHVAIAIAGAGAALYLGTRLLTYFRVQQVSDIVSMTRALFPPAGAELVLDRIATLIDAGGAARSNDVIGTHIATAVERATQPITTGAQDLLARIEAESAAKSAQILEAVLAEFLGGFQQRFATQMTELGELIAGTRGLAEALHEAFARSEAKLADDTAQLGQAMLDGVSEAVERAVARQAEASHAVVHHLDETVSQLGAGMATLAASTEAAMATWTGRTEEVTKAVVARGVEELKRTASAFGQLHTILETLSITVLPAINKLVTTQERLQAAILSCNGSTQSVSAAASDLGEAARIAREMVERQILFTRELAQLAHREPPLEAPPPNGEDLVRAIDALRAEADDERKSLPQL